jgi:hypothetical protein
MLALINQYNITILAALEEMINLQRGIYRIEDRTKHMTP